MLSCRVFPSHPAIRSLQALSLRTLVLCPLCDSLMRFKRGASPAQKFFWQFHAALCRRGIEDCGYFFVRPQEHLHARRAAPNTATCVSTGTTDQARRGSLRMTSLQPGHNTCHTPEPVARDLPSGKLRCTRLAPSNDACESVRAVPTSSITADAATAISPDCQCGHCR